MFLLTEPTKNRIQQFIDTQSELPFSYDEVGATRDRNVAGYPINQYRVEIGKGEDVFTRAVITLRKWSMYNLSWTKLCWPDSPIQEGAVVAILARHYGFWSLNACRVIYSLEESGSLMRNGFAFGTLPDHSEQGEEQFTIEWDRKSNTVWYELYAFARPIHPLAILGWPIAHQIQRRFARESGQAIINEVNRMNA